MHPVRMRIGGPLPAWTDAQYALAQAVYDDVVAQEESAARSGRFDLALPSDVRTNLADAFADYLVHLIRTGLLP